MYYGARAPKLSRILGCTIEEAEVYIENFWSGNQGVRMVIDYLEKFYKKHKYIVGLDGRKMQIRQEYKLLNTAIQGTAALIYKMWCLNTNRIILQEKNIYCRQIFEYHDELGFRAHKDDEERSKEIINLGANMVQDQLNLITPITIDCKVGMNWGDVH